MIIGHETGDITHPSNPRDIIIGMNRQLKDVRQIGLPFVKNLSLAGPLDLGGVLSFKFDDTRKLHMLICHELDGNKWNDAHKYVRFGLDFLWHQEKDSENPRDYSVVAIGTGRLGTRDEAESDRINRAMANSFLNMTLFVNHTEPERAAMHDALVVPMQAYRQWTPAAGEMQIAA